MGDQRSRFEEIIRDVEAFQLMLDGAFKSWRGTYDVLLADTGRYLFQTKKENPAFRGDFCGKLCSKEAGERICREFDLRVAKNAEVNGVSETYPCPRGLRGIAVPVLIDGESLATIFCGQVLTKEEEDREAFIQKTRQLEKALGFKAGELVSLAENVPQISLAELNETKYRLEKLVTYISLMGHERLELQEARVRDQQRLEISDILARAAQSLSDLAVGKEQFWNKVSGFLDEVALSLGAKCGMILIPDEEADTGFRHRVMAITRLPSTPFEGVIYSLKDEPVESTDV